MPMLMPPVVNCANRRDEHDFDSLGAEARGGVEDESVDDFVTPDDWECDGTTDRGDNSEINGDQNIRSPDPSEQVTVSQMVVCATNCAAAL